MEKQHSGRSSFSGKLGFVPVGSRRLGWLGQYLAVPIPGGKIWRWNFSADLHSAGGHLLAIQ